MGHSAHAMDGHPLPHAPCTMWGFNHIWELEVGCTLPFVSYIDGRGALLPYNSISFLSSPFSLSPLLCGSQCLELAHVVWRNGTLERSLPYARCRATGLPVRIFFLPLPLLDRHPGITSQFFKFGC